MANTPRSEAEVAFITAAAVLLALPLLAALGLAALALTTSTGIEAGLGTVSSEEAGWTVWILFGVWVVLAVAAVLAFTVRFIRRSM